MDDSVRSCFDDLDAVRARWAHADAKRSGWMGQFDVTELGIAALALYDLAGTVGAARDSCGNTFLSIDWTRRWLASIAGVVGAALARSARVARAVGAGTLRLSTLGYTHGEGDVGARSVGEAAG